MNIKRSIAKRISKIFGEPEAKIENALINNLYKTNYSKTVLISYITAPFRSSDHFMHQNYITSHIIAESFSELEYNVDIVDYSDLNLVIDYEKYAVVFGFGHNLERSFYSLKKDIFRIHFITGAHPDLQNAMSLKSVKDFYRLSGLWLPDEAGVLPGNNYYSTFNADSAIILAHGHVFEEYKSRFENQVYSLNNNILGLFTNFKPKTPENRSSNFLFLSGARQISKGLHLVLEVAKLREDLNFYIVVPYIKQALEDYYKNILTNQANVFLYKNIRMDSEEMKQIIESCSYALAPSYTDGLPGGTIEPMSAGLIPIVSKYCGFPEEKFIFELADLSSEGLNEAIDKVLKLDDATYMEYSDSVKTFALENFSEATVKKEFTKILKSSLPSPLNL